jgi:phage tail sheath protein FI
MTLAALPGYRVVDAAPSAPEPGLRNDVTAFVGSTERGPLGVPVRVEGRQAYVAMFGGWGTGTVPRALSAYVANGGLVAWVVRAGHGGSTAGAEVELADPDAPVTDGPARCSLPGSTVRCSATSPGTWANGTVVRLVYRAFGITGEAELDVAVEAPGWPSWRRSGLAPDELPAAVGASGLVSLTFSGPPRPSTPGPGNPGPAVLSWELVLGGGQEPVLDAMALRQGIAAQAEIDEIALVCIPGVAELLGDGQYDVTATLAESCAEAQDRLAVISGSVSDAAGLTEWRTRLHAAIGDPTRQRAVAAYVPWLRSADLTGRGLDRYPPTDPVGHVCGVIARLDRERGSGWSPANVLVSDAVDTAAPMPLATQALAMGEGVNLLRGRPGGGLEIWGARTLDPEDGRYVAHRRLVHRIVRAVRRVLEPLVFDTNDRLLWFSVTRAVSGVLMEAWRSGSLRGETPDQAYRVRCDETTNPPEAIDDGRVVCQVELAPATPMEFITLRLTLGAEGLLEVVEQ